MVIDWAVDGHADRGIRVGLKPGPLRGIKMHFSLAAVFAGGCLFCLAATLHFLGQGFEWRDQLAVMAANETVEPDNPPRVVIQKLPSGAVNYLNVGGLARHTPAPGFTNYDDAFNEIRARYRWLKRLGTVCSLFGVVLMVSGSVGLLRFFA